MDVVTRRWNKADGWDGALPALDGPSTLVLAFGSSNLLDDPSPVAALVGAFPTSVVVGCSTAGEILDDTLDDDTVTVAITRFDATALQVASAPVAQASASASVGEELARTLCAGPDGPPDAVFVLSDGLVPNGSALVAGLMAGVPSGTVVTGGLAGDGDRFGRTWVIADGELRTGWVTAVGLRGSRLRVGHGSRGGWDQFGPLRRITKSAGNVLYEVDGQPALALYKQYLGDRAKELPAAALLFPLAIRIPGADDRELVRTILAVDEAAQSLTFAGDVPEGSTAQLMRANFDRLVDGASVAAESSSVPGDEPGLAVAISCVGRRLLLGSRTEDELEAVRSGLDDRMAVVGFYSYGEISPVTTGTCDLHNQTMTVTTFREAA